jgi:hypothetical protein
LKAFSKLCCDINVEEQAVTEKPDAVAAYFNSIVSMAHCKLVAQKPARWHVHLGGPSMTEIAYETRTPRRRKTYQSIPSLPSLVAELSRL